MKQEQEQAMHADGSRIRVRNRLVLTADRAKAGSLPNRGTVPALAALLLLLLSIAACGGSSNPIPDKNPLVDVRVSANSSPSMEVAGTLQLSASGGYGNPPGDISYKDVTSSATWSTSDAAVATVSQGLVTGTGIGTASISAAFDGKSGSTAVFVGLTHYITISPAGPFSLSATPETDFFATETFSNGSQVDVSGPATWTVSPGGVISIYPYLGGHATLIATGTTTVTATLASGEAGSVEVTVVP